MGCAWVAEGLVRAGYALENTSTEECVARWHGVSPEHVREGDSADYLRRSGQADDLDFVLRHIDDLETVPHLVDGELMSAPHASTTPPRAGIGAAASRGEV